MVKKLPAMQETWVQSLGWEDPSEEGHGNPLQYSCLENLTVGLAGYSPRGGKELDMTNSFSFHQLSVLTLADFPFPGVGTVAPPPSQDEALSRYSASGEVPR